MNNDVKTVLAVVAHADDETIGPGGTLARHAAAGAQVHVLVLTDGLDSAVYLAARNLPNVQVMDIAIVDPVSLIRQDKVVIDEAALKKLEERLA